MKKKCKYLKHFLLLFIIWARKSKIYEAATIPRMHFYSFLYYRLKENEFYYSMNEQKRIKNMSFISQ